MSADFFDHTRQSLTTVDYTNFMAVVQEATATFKDLLTC
jgi:hypothetical protein